MRRVARCSVEDALGMADRSIASRSGSRRTTVGDTVAGPKVTASHGRLPEGDPTTRAGTVAVHGPLFEEETEASHWIGRRLMKRSSAVA